MRTKSLSSAPNLLKIQTLWRQREKGAFPPVQLVRVLVPSGLSYVSQELGIFHGCIHTHTHTPQIHHTHTHMYQTPHTLTNTPCTKIYTHQTHHIHHTHHAHTYTYIPHTSHIQSKHTCTKYHNHTHTYTLKF